jgi:3-(3-hydroxy-phenyl)propionate hydroxylase
LERHAVYTFRAAIADIWRKGRVLLAGDAAHVMPPFAAQGLCGGLRDVAALSWRLDALLRNAMTDDVLESYQAERPPAIRPFRQFAMNLGRMSCLRDPQERVLALQAARAAGSKFPAPPLGHSALTRAGDPSSGSLSIQGRIRQHGRSGRFDDLVGQGFLLIGNDCDPALNLNVTQRSFLQSIGARTVGVGTTCNIQDIDGAYRRWFEQLHAPAILVRPDFYIYGSGKASHIVDDLMRAWPANAGAR